MTNPEMSWYNRTGFRYSQNMNRFCDCVSDNRRRRRNENNENNENNESQCSHYPRWPPFISSSTQAAPRRPQAPVVDKYKKNYINLCNLITVVVNNLNCNNDNLDWDNLNNLYYNNLNNLNNLYDSDFDNLNNLCDSDFDNLCDLITIIKNCKITINIRENKIIKLQEQIINLKKEINQFYEQSTNSNTTEKTKCCVCLEQPSNFANNICGHLCLCSNCVNQVEKCPICRQEGRFIKIISS